MDRTYTFSSTNNDGRITQMADAVSGETVVYQYDSLKRLISASTTGPQWGQSFGYDAFGNLLNQVTTKGSTPPIYVNVDAATNRIMGGDFGYDANGNLTAAPSLTMSYDVENRLVVATHSANGTERYVYDPSGQRVWKEMPYGAGTIELVYFYSVDGTLLGTYKGSSNTDYNVYFAGKLVWAEATSGSWYVPAGPVALDRLGSVVHRYGSANRYFPYGDEPATTTQDRAKFATYYRDQTSTLDYARNRYYSRAIGRFTTPDPYMASGGPADPQSWNSYAYVQNDPVNFNDPAGLMYNLVLGGMYGDDFHLGPGFALGLYPMIGLEGWGSSPSIGARLTTGTPVAVPGDGGGPDPAQAALALLPAAVKRLQDAFNDPNNPCRGFFGTGLGDVAKVLADLAVGTSRFGSIQFGELSSDRVAQTGVVQSSGTVVGGQTFWGQATITISTQAGAAYWNGMSLDDRARTLLHELGHFYGFVAASGGSDFLYDLLPSGGVDWNAADFNAQLEKECIP